MTKRIPERLAWAVEVLDVKPADRLLEIGCGRGLAVSLIREKRVGGSITAIDRSDVMIRAAREKNPEELGSGKVTFLTTALAEADFEGARFDKIFAVNVNLFWLDASRELELIRGLLAPRGTLSLFYEPPTAAKLRPIADKLTAMLEAHGFRVTAVRTEHRNSAHLLCVVAAPAQKRRGKNRGCSHRAEEFCLSSGPTLHSRLHLLSCMGASVLLDLDLTKRLLSLEAQHERFLSTH